MQNKIHTLSALLIFSLAASASHAATITCKQGKNSCGFRFPIFTKGASYTENEVRFLDNTDYQRLWSDRYDQINKLFGATDCGEIFDARKNSALVGWRHIKGTQEIELTGYVHRASAMQNGVNFRHAPLGIVPRSTKSQVRIETLTNHYLFNLNGQNLLS